MIKQIYLDKNLSSPIGDWFSDLYITGFQLEKCLLKDRNFTFAIVSPDIPSTAIAISLGLIWNNIFKKKKEEQNIISNNLVKMSTRSPYIDYLKSLNRGDELYLKNNKNSKKRIFFDSCIKDDLHGPFLFKFHIYEGNKQYSNILPLKKIKQLISIRSKYVNNYFLENFFYDTHDQKNFSLLRNFIYILGEKSKFAKISESDVFIENTKMGTDNRSTKGRLGDFLRITEEDNNLDYISTIKSDRVKINFEEVAKREFTIFLGSNSFIKHSTQRKIKNKIVILGTKDAQLHEAVNILNNNFITTEVFKENFEKIQRLERNFPALFYQ